MFNMQLLFGVVNIIEEIQIDNNVYPILLRLLRNKTGLNFQYYRRNFIEGRIKARMIRAKCKTLQAYYNHLFSDDNEFRKFLDAFNINYTFFFRDWEVYDIFQRIFLRSLKYRREALLGNIKPKPIQLAQFRTKENYLKNLQKKRKINQNTINSPFFNYLKRTSVYNKIQSSRSSFNKINIWSCACASGEEPYTIAMILNNLKKQIQRFPGYHITASDIDNDTIIKAITGVYEEYSMKEITSYYKTKYFTKITQNSKFAYLISNEIISDVEFINEDITKGHKKLEKYDIIFCRYLLIYFNRENRNLFAKIIENRLNPGGILILGKTETLFNKFSKLKLLDSANQIYLKK